LTGLQPSLTFVCCIEAGPLEHEVVRLVESLRKWGGRFAGCPVLAIKPRLGPPPTKATLRTLEAAEATYVSLRPGQRYAWFHYMNKALVLEAAEARAHSEQIVWLDSDIMVLGEPDALELGDGEDFAFVAGSKHGGTTGPDDPGEPLWRALCEATGLALDDLPWIHNEMDDETVRFYFNVGAFAVRRDAGLGRVFRQTLLAILDAHIRCHEWGLGLIEQAAVGLAVLRAGLRWRQRPYIYNYHVGPGIPELYHKPELMQHVRLLHHHRAMRPDYWPKLLELLREHHPKLHDWLAPQGPILYGPRIDGWRSATWSLLRGIGRVQRKRHEARCRTL
jgi:hypothetical protein